MKHGSNKAVLTAIVSNFLVTLFKFGAALLTHSASMMNEAIHSLMDTANQGFLYRGLVEAKRPADQTYAFGHAQKRYLWNLWSAIGLFSIGAGLGLAHAYHAWINLGTAVQPGDIHFLDWTIKPIWISISVLAIAFVLESYSFMVAMRELLKRMRQDNHRNPFTYITVADDPTLIAIVLEDSIAVIGLTLAAIGIGLAAFLGDPRWDIGFSIIIALMLGLMAVFLGFINMRYLTDIRDPRAEAAFAEVVANHREVERYHDLRSIVLDENHTILVAEVELREEAMLAGLQKKIDNYETDISKIVPENRLGDPALVEYIHNRAAVQATLERTEEILEELVAEVKTRAPQVCHATIEVEGIASPPEEPRP